MTPATKLFAFVSNASDGDIGVIAIDRTYGHARTVQRCAAGDRVMPMAVAPDKTHLYAATRGSSPAIVRFAFNAAMGQLVRGESAPVTGSYAYVTVDPSGRYLLGASYGQNRVDVYRTDRLLAGDGATQQSIEGIAHAHSIVISTDGRFAYAASLGANEVVCFRTAFDGTTEPLAIIDRVTLGATFGPRHLRISPSGTWLCVVSEFQATVAIFRRDPVTGRITLTNVSPRAEPLQRLNVGMARPLPDDPSLKLPPVESMIWGADIHVRPDGRFVYVSERTLSKLIVYRVVGDGGDLEYASAVDTETQPRGFNIDTTGSILVACGEKSNRVSVYSIDGQTGALTPTSTCPGGDGANWIEMFEA